MKGSYTKLETRLAIADGANARSIDLDLLLIVLILFWLGYNQSNMFTNPNSSHTFFDAEAPLHSSFQSPIIIGIIVLVSLNRNDSVNFF
jgi:hypothetical protein